ncbi:MAG TPA: YoaP domain-containing protein [Selenomonadales bacterium]|nr:YoaP domain-containing protein [Selenomonadales bacterium]
MAIISLTAQNIGTEHICCALSDKKGESGVSRKKAWLTCRFAEGLRFRRLDERGKVLIEYLPAENAWVPVDAKGYMFINCHWVSGRFQGRGYGHQLLAECEKDARAMNGVAVISSPKKRPFLADKSFFVKNGFEVCDTAEPYFELLVKKYKTDAPTPRFLPNAKTLRVNAGAGLDIYYTAQCPFAVNYTHGLAEAVKDLPVRLHEFTTREEARRHACPATTYSVFLNGKFITHEILTLPKLLKLLEVR